MIFKHEFTTPRNVYDKLVRDYEHLDMVVSGDTFFNFVSTAYFLLEWLKNAQQNETLSRFVKRLAKDPNIKICKDILTFKVTYSITIDDPELEEGSIFEHVRLPENYDLPAYTNGTRKFKLIIGNNEYDIFKFKEEVLNLFNIYFKVK